MAIKTNLPSILLSRHFQFRMPGVLNNLGDSIGMPRRLRRHCTHRQQTGVVATAYVARINVSYETREANDDEGKSRRKTPPKAQQTQFARGSHQLLRAKRIADRRQRRQAHHQQTELAPPRFGTKRKSRFHPAFLQQNAMLAFMSCAFQRQNVKFASSLNLCQNARTRDPRSA